MITFKILKLATKLLIQIIIKLKIKLALKCLIEEKDIFKRLK